MNCIYKSNVVNVDFFVFKFFEVDPLGLVGLCLGDFEAFGLFLLDALLLFLQSLLLGFSLLFNHFTLFLLGSGFLLRGVIGG